MTAWEITVEPVPADHPCLPGHFPGNPIVPGTLLLEKVIDCLSQRHSERQVCEVVSTKFLSPLKPEQGFSIRFREHGEAIDFECRRGDTTISSGKLKLTHREALG